MKSTRNSTTTSPAAASTSAAKRGTKYRNEKSFSTHITRQVKARESRSEKELGNKRLSIPRNAKKLVSFALEAPLVAQQSQVVDTTLTPPLVSSSSTIDNESDSEYLLLI